jgi:hypothetical protein
MRNQIQQAVWSSTFQNVEPYLVLRIRRASILNDTIVQVILKSVHQQLLHHLQSYCYTLSHSNHHHHHYHYHEELKSWLFMLCCVT